MKRLENELPRWLLDLIASCPSAGTGVHGWLYKVARQLHAHRDKSEIFSLLRAACDGCGRIVSDREIADAITSAESTAWKPSGDFLNSPAAKPKWEPVNQKARAELIRDSGGLPDLWEASPRRIEDNGQHTEGVIDLLFPDNPLLCCGQSSYEFDTKSRDDWRGVLSSLQLIVPSPMSSIEGVTKEGKPSKHSLSNTGPRRFLVTEFDSGSLDEHAAILLHLASRGPLVLVVHSGGKSLHGWFYCAGQPEERVRRFFSYAVSLGADPATWTKSQFVRMPDGTRDNGKRQTVYFINPRPLEISK